MSQGLVASDDNPFRPVAVAIPREFDDTTVSIVTPAVAEVVSLVDSFLRSSTTQAGNVVAIVGDYGSGKSHLLGTLLHQARDRPAEQRPRIALLEASPSTFADLYRQLVVQELGKADVRERVREQYAHLIADELSDSRFTADIAALLRTGDLDPVEVSSRLKLMESRHLDALRRLLERVTRNRAFSVALTLLLRPDFADAAWEWLTGHQPDQVLVDRGISTAIATEELSLEAMGVLALLYTSRGRPFVLAIDEMNKIVSANRKPAVSVVSALEKMIEVFAGTRALLVLAGLPDYLDELGTGVQQRIGRVVTASPLTAADTSEFIRQSQNRLGRGRVLNPFTEDTVRYLVKLTDGNARRIIRLCGHLYRQAVDASLRYPDMARVTEAMVRHIAREHSGTNSVDNVRNEIRQVLSALGLTYERDVWMRTDTKADYFVPFTSSANSGCALVLTESVLNRADSDALVGRAAALRSAAGSVVLIVVGLVNSDFLPELTEAFSVEPIVHDLYTFNDTLSAVLERQLDLSAGPGDRSMSDMREQFTRLSRQQENTQRILEQAMKTLTSLRASSDRSFTQLQQELAEFASEASPRHGHGFAQPVRLPPAVLALFLEARASLAVVDQFDSTLRSMFAPPGSGPGNAVDARVAVRAQLRSQRFFQALGVSSMLRTLLSAFEDGVSELFRSRVPGRPHQRDREQLSALCRAYDTIFEYVPFFRLEEVDQIAPYLVDGNLAVLVSPPQLAEARELFSGLSSQVHATVLASIADWR